MDKGYYDFERLIKLTREKTSFVISAKEIIHYRVISRSKTNKEKVVICDQTIVLADPLTIKKCAEYLDESGIMIMKLGIP